MKLRQLIPLLAGILFIWNVWGYDLWAPDEPYFAEGAREMVVDGHWMVPHVDGVVTTDKPPLFFWLIAVFSLPFGNVSSLTARLPSVLAAVGSVILAIRLGHRLYGERVGTYAGVLLMTNYLFWDKARSAQTDAVLAFLILAALSAFEAFRSGAMSGRRAGLLFWLAAALAVIDKGPVGMLLPLGIAVLTLVTDRRVRRWAQFAPLSGPLLFLGVLALWIVPASLWDPAQYTVWGAFREHFVDRAMHGMHHAQPPWYYATVLPVKLLPWSALVPGALLLAWRRREASDRFLLVTVAFVVLFFSISTEKRDLYVLPAFPAFALMTAALVDAVQSERNGITPRWISIPQGLTGGIFAVLGGIVLFLRDRVDVLPAWITIATGTLLLLTGLATLITVATGFRVRSVGATLAGVAATYLFVSTAVFPALDPVKSSRAFSTRLRAETAASRAAGGEVVAYWLLNLPEAFALYTNGDYFVETEELDILVEHLNNPRRRFAVVNRDRLDGLPPEIARRLVTVAETRLSRMPVALVHNGRPGP